MSPTFVERTRGGGELLIQSPFGGTDGRRLSYLTCTVGNWTTQDGRGINFGTNAGFALGDGSCLSPDAAWVSLERWNALTVDEQESFAPLCPEFVIEMRSRNETRSMVEAKMLGWMENGAQLAWLIDPLA